MLLGMNTAPVGLHVLEGIRWIREKGLDFVELSCGDVPNRKEYIHRCQITEEFIEKLRAACADFRLITLHPEVPSAFLISDSDGRTRAIHEMGTFIDLAGELGSKILTFHAGSASKGASDAEVREICADSFGRLVERAGKSGVRLGLEPVPGYFGVAERFEILEDVGLPDLGITLDVGHLCLPHPACPGKPAYFPLASIGAFIAQFAERLIHLHVHDNHGQRDEHLAIGEGSIDFSDIARSLRKIGYSGTVCFEVPREKTLDCTDRWKQLLDDHKLS